MEYPFECIIADGYGKPDDGTFMSGNADCHLQIMEPDVCKIGSESSAKQGMGLPLPGQGYGQEGEDHTCSRCGLVPPQTCEKPSSRYVMKAVTASLFLLNPVHRAVTQVLHSGPSSGKRFSEGISWNSQLLEGTRDIPVPFTRRLRRTDMPVQMMDGLTGIWCSWEKYLMFSHVA